MCVLEQNTAQIGPKQADNQTKDGSFFCFVFYQTLGLEFSMTFKYTMNNLVVAQTIISGHDG